MDWVERLEMQKSMMGRDIDYETSELIFRDFEIRVKNHIFANKKYKVITLCGSTKFKDEFMKAQRDLTLQKNIVVSVGLFGHADGEYQGELTEEAKIMLDDMHKRKIDMADEIFVINKNGYIGSSTKSEIEYAKSIGKKISYFESMKQN